MRAMKRAETYGCAITEDEKKSVIVDPVKERARMTPPMHVPPAWFSSGQKWIDVDGGSWREHDHINLGEARGTLRIAEIISSNPRLHRLRHPILSDNRVVVGSFTKGRSPSRKLNKLLRKFASLQLATGMQMMLTWVYTKFTPADALSRDRARRDALRRSRSWA